MARITASVFNALRHEASERGISERDTDALCTALGDELEAAVADRLRDQLPDELARLRAIGLKSWAPGTRDHFIRISPVMLNGRRLPTDSTQLAQQP